MPVCSDRKTLLLSPREITTTIDCVVAMRETKNNQNVAHGSTGQSAACLVITVYIHLEKKAPLERLTCLLSLQSPAKHSKTFVGPLFVWVCVYLLLRQ